METQCADEPLQTPKWMLADAKVINGILYSVVPKSLAPVYTLPVRIRVPGRCLFTILRHVPVFPPCRRRVRGRLWLFPTTKSCPSTGATKRMISSFFQKIDPIKNRRVAGVTPTDSHRASLRPHCFSPNLPWSHRLPRSPAGLWLRQSQLIPRVWCLRLLAAC